MLRLMGSFARLAVLGSKSSGIDVGKNAAVKNHQLSSKNMILAFFLLLSNMA